MKLFSEIFTIENAGIAPHEERYHLLNKYLFIFAFCGHTLFLPVFFLLKQDIPFYNNIICVLLDILCIYLNSKLKLRVVYIIFVIEISLHTFFCNIIFGWGTGFLYYFFTITFYIFLVREYRFLKIFLFTTVSILFIIQYFYLQTTIPVYPATIIPVWLIYFLNAFANFIAIAFTSTEFSLFVNKAERTIIKAKEKAEEGERAKSVFLANISHEIRSPLNSIVGMINLSLFTDNNKEKKQYLHIAKNSADHLLTVINDILDYSKIEENSMSLRNEVFNIHHLLKNTMMAMDSSIYDKNLTMKYEISEAVPQNVYGDPSRLRQVLMNLLSNAIKFTDSGSITVTCKKISDNRDICDIEFSVEDTGHGIPDDKINLVFDRFTQLEIKDAKKYTGTGLGLAISKELVELMGGTIGVKSKVDTGSIFTFRIPFYGADYTGKNTNPCNSTSVQKYNKSLNILIAEDIFTNWLLYEKYMQILGHSCKIVENGKLALEELNRNCYDLVLMDIEMPEMNGGETLKQIRSSINGSNKDIPVIAMTGYTENDLYDGDYKFNGFLIKPVELDDLNRMIHDIMSLKETNIKT